MRVPRHDARGDVGFNMTPMIDVVFLLIIFFLVSSHLARQESHLELDLPLAESGEDPQDETAARLTVNVLPDGNLLLGTRPVTPGELRVRLRERRADDSDLQVRIRGDRTVPYGIVEPVLLACVHAGIWDVSFSVFHPEDVR